MSAWEGRQGLPRQPGKPDGGSRKDSAQEPLSLRPLLESLGGGEFIVTVLLGKEGEGDAGET